MRTPQQVHTDSEVTQYASKKSVVFWIENGHMHAALPYDFYNDRNQHLYEEQVVPVTTPEQAQLLRELLIQLKQATDQAFIDLGWTQWVGIPEEG